MSTRRLLLAALAGLLVCGVGGAQAPAQPGWTGTLTCAVPVRDMKSAQSWYRDTLGFKAAATASEKWAVLETPLPALRLALFPAPKDARGGGAWLTFGVKDLAAARKKLESKQVKFVGNTVTVAGMVKLATFEDPDGNKFKLFQLLQPGAERIPGVGALDYTRSVVASHAVKSLKAAVAWYGENLGFRFFFNLPTMKFCELHTPVRGVAFGLQETERPAVGGGPVLLWGVKDLKTARALLQSRKIKPAEGTAPLPDGQPGVTFLDPDGNRMLFTNDPPVGKGTKTKEKTDG